MRKTLFLILLFCFLFLILFQSGFLFFLKFTPNLILIAVLILLIFEKQKNTALISIIFAGIFLDIFSKSPFGTATLSLISIYFIVNLFFKFFLKTNLLEVSLILILGTFFYNIFSSIFSYLLKLLFYSEKLFILNFNYALIFETIFNLVLGIAAFYIIKRFKLKHGLFPTAKRAK